MASATRVDPDRELAEFVGQFYDDPLGFVLACFPWGEPGTSLEKYDGPDKWQREFLEWVGSEVKARKFDGVTPVAPIRGLASSGHGVGKTTLQAWLVLWIMSTRPNCRGKLTANTNDQLDTNTWAAVRHWTKLCITASWFEVNTAKMYAKGQAESWFCSPQSCREEYSESFAGQHAATSTSFYIFDEASAVPEKIYEVAEGGLTDGEPMIFLFGNPTRSTGSFHRAAYGSMSHRWHAVTVDSRESKLTNKDQIAEWIRDYGEDSDFVRVRVRGLPPRASDLQFIDQERVWQAQNRLATSFAHDALVAGVDVSDGGSAWNVVRFRKGSDARTIPPIRIPGEKVRNDRSSFLARLADVLTNTYNGERVSMMFIDSAFGAPYVEGLHRMGHKNVQEVRFGAESPDPHQANMRAFMWNKAKEWLPSGAIDPKDRKLETDLTAPGYHLNRQDRLVIESKEDMAKRGVASLDDGDALALTFAASVKAKATVAAVPLPPQFAWS